MTGTPREDILALYAQGGIEAVADAYVAVVELFSQRLSALWSPRFSIFGSSCLATAATAASRPQTMVTNELPNPSVRSMPPRLL